METRISGSTPWWVQDSERPTEDERWLLELVEESFAEVSADLTEWADPHYDPSAPGHRRDSEEEEYSRCPEPEKYNIALARAEAWVTVLTGLGWADVTTVTGGVDEPGSGIEWALPPWSHQAHGTLTVLHPTAEQAVPLVFWSIDADEFAANVSVCAGDPAVFLDQIPDCGCDACDSGSEDLLRVIDEMALAVVGGSLIVELEKKWLSIRHGVGVQGGGPNPQFRRSASFQAQPWSRTWTPRAVYERIDPPRRRPGPRMPRVAGRFAPLPSKAELKKMQSD